MQARWIGACLLSMTIVAGCSSQRSVETLRSQANFNFAHGNFATAAADYQEIAYRYPGDWHAQYQLGLCALETGNLAEARQALEIANSRRPNDPAIADALAEAIYKRGDKDDLFEFLHRRAESMDTVRAHLRLAKYSLEVNDPDSARRSIERALMLTDGQSVETQLAAADLAGYLGDRQQRITHLQHAFRLNPHDPRVRSALTDLGEVPGPTLGLTPTNP